MATNARIIPIGNEERTVRSDANIRWPEPLIKFADCDVFDRCGVACTVGFGYVRSNDVGTRIAVDDLIAEFCGEQVAFVDCNSGRRASAGEQDVWYHAWVVEVPVTTRNLGLPIRALDLPACAVGLVRVSEVTKFHDIVDTCCAVSVIIVVGLPKRSERVNRDLVVVSEIVAEHFHVAQVFVASKHHSLAVGFARVVDFSAPTILDWIAVGVAKSVAGVSVVEVEFTIGAKHK